LPPNFVSSLRDYQGLDSRRRGNDTLWQACQAPGCQNESLTDFPDMLIGNYRRVSLLLMFKVVSLYTLTAMFKKALYVLF